MQNKKVKQITWLSLYPTNLFVSWPVIRIIIWICLIMINRGCNTIFLTWKKYLCHLHELNNTHISDISSYMILIHYCCLTLYIKSTSWESQSLKFVLFISVYNNINFVTVYILYLIIIICNILLVFLIYRPNKYVYVYVCLSLTN
jgi:hypothetical protein